MASTATSPVLSAEKMVGNSKNSSRSDSKDRPCIERFVPVGVASLVDDAPGWSQRTAPQNGTSNSSTDTNAAAATAQEEEGPTCWKCKGSGLGKMPKKRRRKEANSSDGQKLSTKEEEPKQAACSVCHGKGHLPPKLQEAKALQHRPGEVTRIRKCPPGWTPHGPLPYALQQRGHNNSTDTVVVSHNEEQAVRLVRLAESSRKEVSVILVEEEGDEKGKSQQSTITTTATMAEIQSTATATIKQKSPFRTKEALPLWLPRRGEQLCNLVGTWRILQRVASHRWTTDDLVTSYLAGRYIASLTMTTKKTSENNSTSKEVQQSDGRGQGIRYLDLGCGNGSVLQMTTWQLLAQYSASVQQDTADTTEPAKAKAVAPAILCRGIEARKEALQLARRSISYNVGGDHDGVDIAVHHGDFRSFFDQNEHYKEYFDLVTGTPPYFRVDFTVGKAETATTSSGGEATTDNVVQKAVINQGGMPSCKQSAPARCEFRGGVEAYCKAAAQAMHRQSVFCVCENWLNDDRVYQGAKEAGLVVVEVLPVQGRTGKPSPLFAVYVLRKESYFEEGTVPATKLLDYLIVRDDEGNWTAEYKKVLQVMSIPVP